MCFNDFTNYKYVLVKEFSDLLCLKYLVVRLDRFGKIPGRITQPPSTGLADF